MSGYLKINPNSLIALGEYIRSQRSKKNIGLREMADILNISSAYLSNLEGGKHAKANPLLLKKIAEILKLDYLKLYKIIGYTDKDTEDIKNSKKNVLKQSKLKNEKVEKIIEDIKKFSKEEFELIEKYIEFLKK